MIYLDNACTSFPKAPGMADAVAQFLETGAFNPSRSGYRAADAPTRTVARLRSSLARLFGVPRAERVVFTSGSTHAINIALLGCLAEGSRAAAPRVLVTSMSHNAISRPLARLDRLGVIERVEIPCARDGSIDPGAIIDQLDERVAMVCMTHASNVTGTIQPVGQVGRAIREMGHPALLLVDAAQSAGALDIDIERDHIDLLAFSGHKHLRGPTGIGGLCVGPRAFADDADPETQPLRSVFAGGTGDSSERMPASLPARFEPGTPNTLGMVALLAALEHLTPADIASNLAHERRLTSVLRESLREIPGVRTFGPDDPLAATGALSITIEGVEPSDACAMLDGSFSIAVRSGIHCAPRSHATLGTLESGGTIRLSPGPATTPSDIDAAISAIREIAAG